LTSDGETLRELETLRRRNQLRIEHLGRMLDAIRRVGHLSSREKNEVALAQGACDALVDSGSFGSAWLVLLTPGGERLKYGSVGLGEAGAAFHARLERGLRPPCWALVAESGDDCLVLPDASVCATCPLGDGLSPGDALVAPLRHEGEYFGALGVRLGSGGDAAEDHALLVQIADDLGLALHDMRAEGRRSAYRQIVECTDDGLALIGPGHVYLEANEAYAHYWGWTGGDIVGRSVREVVGEEFYETVARGRLDRALAGEAFAVELPFRVDGQVSRFTDVGFAPARDAAGAVTGVVISVRDATQRRGAESRLRASEARLSAIFHRSPVGILFSSLDEGRIVDVNEAGARMFGYEVGEMVGRSTVDLALWAEAGDREKVVEILRAHGSARDLEMKGRRRDGEVRDLSMSLECFEMDGKLFAIGVGQDLTDRKRAESEHQRLEARLRASQKLEAIGQLAGGVAHDFNNLLVVILNYTDFALQALREDDPMHRDLTEVRRAGERAAGLTRQLLAFSRKQVLQPVPLRLNQITEGLERMLRRIVGEDIELALALDPDAGVVMADPGQIEQVLMNLVVNARDAMPDGGRLTITTRNLMLDGRRAAGVVEVVPGAYVELAVTDVGVGMDEDTRARVFEPFFTTKEQGQGTGLGLSTCYGIVRQSNGYIWIESEVGRGTTVRIQLPRERYAVPSAPLVPAARLPRGTETILVVEDEPALRTLVRRLLENAGYRVQVAADGEEALELAATLDIPVDLLLTDVVMPRAGGHRVARDLQARWPRLAVLFMSGYTDDAIAKRGVLEPGTHFLAKPFNVDSLLRKVRDVLDARPGVRAD